MLADAMLVDKVYGRGVTVGECVDRATMSFRGWPLGVREICAGTLPVRYPQLLTGQSRLLSENVQTGNDGPPEGIRAERVHTRTLRRPGPAGEWGVSGCKP